MPSVKCPECGNRVKVRDDTQLRCSQCGEKFDLPDEDEAEERAPRPRMKRKADAPKSSGTKIAAIVVGGVLLLAVVGLAVVLIVRKSGKDGPSQPIDSTKVTRENFKSLRPGLTLAEIESVLGGSRSSSEDELRAALRNAGSVKPLEQMMGTYGGVLDEISEWRRWEGKEFRVWVAFVKTKDGPRAAYSTSLASLLGGYSIESGFVVSGANELEKANDDRSQESAIRNDPKWVKGAQARELLLGEWRGEKANGYLFGQNGQMIEWNTYGMDLNHKPTYRFVDDRVLEITTRPFDPPPGHPTPPGFVNQPPTISKYEYYVNQDELALIDVTSMGIGGAPKLHHIYYRLPVRPGSAGETKLVAPLLADLKGPDIIKRNHALQVLEEIARGLAVALPTLLELLGGSDLFVAEYASFIIGRMKESARPAIPTLLGILQGNNVKRAIFAARALGQMGPAARDAVPVLREVMQKSRNNDLRTAADSAIVSITNPINP